MKSYQLIHQLINLVAELEEENQGREASIQDFTGFLLNKVGDATDNNTSSEVRFGENDSAALVAPCKLAKILPRWRFYLHTIVYQSQN
jgi:hypothetical protein